MTLANLRGLPQPARQGGVANRWTWTVQAASKQETLNKQLMDTKEEVLRLRAELAALRALASVKDGKVEQELERLRRENAALVEDNAQLKDKRPRTSSWIATKDEKPPADPKLEAALFAAAGYATTTRKHTVTDITALRALLGDRLRRVNVNCREGTGTPPLAYAAWAGDEQACQMLIAAGADLDAENLDSATPLHMAVFNNQPRMAAFLIACGADMKSVQDDAKAVGTAEMRAIFHAVDSGGSHAALDAARGRLLELRKEEDQKAPH